MPVQIFLMYCGAYAATNDHKLAIIVTAAYYILKYVYVLTSNNIY